MTRIGCGSFWQSLGWGLAICEGRAHAEALRRRGFVGLGFRGGQECSHSLLEFGGEFLGEGGVLLCEVFGFAGGGGVVVEFEVTVFVFDEAMGRSPDGSGAVVVGNGVAF